MNKFLKFITLTAIVVGLFVVVSSKVSADTWTGDAVSYQCVINNITTNVTINPNDPSPSNFANWAAYLQNYACTLVTPTETLTPTPPVTSTPTPTNTPSNPGGGSDGKNDGLGCGSHDCSNQAKGATQAVLGLSSTNSGSNAYITLAQLILALVLVAGGYKFFKRNA